MSGEVGADRLRRGSAPASSYRSVYAFRARTAGIGSPSRYWSTARKVGFFAAVGRPGLRWSSVSCMALCAVRQGQASELERLLALGARPADVGQTGEDWHALADPEGSAFRRLRQL